MNRGNIGMINLFSTYLFKYIEDFFYCKAVLGYFDIVVSKMR